MDFKTPMEVLDYSATLSGFEKMNFDRLYENKIVYVAKGLYIVHPTWKDTTVVLSKAARYQMAGLYTYLLGKGNFNSYFEAVAFPFYQFWLDGEQLPNEYV